MLSSVLRVLNDFGDAAGLLIAALVLFAYGRRIIQENEKAHAALDTKIDTVAQTLGTKYVGHDLRLDAQSLQGECAETLPSPAAPILRLQRRRAGLAEADVENAFDHLGRNLIPSRRRLGGEVAGR